MTKAQSQLKALWLQHYQRWSQ